MKLRRYLAIPWRRKSVIVIATVVTVLVTALGISVMPPTYEASTTLRVSLAGGVSANYTEQMYAAQLKSTFLTIATSDRVLDELAQRLDLDEAPKLGLELLGNSELMRLTVVHPDPQLAQEAANTMAEILMELNRELYVQVEMTTQEILLQQLAKAKDEVGQAWEDYQETIAEYPYDPATILTAGSAWESKQQTYDRLLAQYEQSRVQEFLKANALSVYDPADLPDTPSGLPKAVHVALGAMVGLTAGAGLAFLFEDLDRTLHGTGEIGALTPLSTLGKIPTVGKQYPISFSPGGSPHEEAFRRLRTNLFALDGSALLRTILVASAQPLEGKTTVVANLACAIAESGRQVVAVDCDLRRSSLHKMFQLSNRMGLTDALVYHEPRLNGYLIETGIENLWVLTSGPLPPQPTELLGSPAMAHLISKLRQRFDVVLLDTPAIEGVTDAAVLAPLADGVLLVVSRGKAQEEDVLAARTQLADVGARLIGVVVNRAEQDGILDYCRV